MKLVVSDEKSCRDVDKSSGIVHRIVRIETRSGDEVKFYRHYIACGLKWGETNLICLDLTVTCIACLAQVEHYVPCRRGSCGKRFPAERMAIHRDTLESYCLDCAMRINQANKDGTLVQMQSA